MKAFAEELNKSITENAREVLEEVCEEISKTYRNNFHINWRRSSQRNFNFDFEEWFLINYQGNCKKNILKTFCWRHLKKNPSSKQFLIFPNQFPKFFSRKKSKKKIEKNGKRIIERNAKI